MPHKENGAPYGTPGHYHVNYPASAWYIKNGGWKIHLTVLPQHYALVDEWLDKYCPGQYKLLSGGDAGEKDFTIYVGKKDDMLKFAKKIENSIGSLLERSNAGYSDRLLTPRIAARFDPGRHNLMISASTGKPSASFYGREGIPYDEEASNMRHQINLNKQVGDEKNKEHWERKLANYEQEIRKSMTKQYGDVFTGTGANELERRKKVVKRKVKRRQVKRCGCKK